MRIDSLKPGTKVTLRFVGRWGNETREESATFLGLEGEGDKREARFESPTGRSWDPTYTWEAYRYGGRWAYGTSAERLQLVEVRD